MPIIYLDHAATTPVHPLVAATFAEQLNHTYGNPSSIHQVGREARKALDDARKQFAQSIGAKPTEIVITSGGTEANNTALFGIANAMKSKGNHIITTTIEHHAVLNTCKQLQQEGFTVTFLEVDENGQIQADQVKDALTDETILVSIMYGNNEVGTIQPIADIGKVLQDHQAVFHTDAVQAYGVIPLDVEALGVDLLSVSAHKLNGPKGIGFLYARTNTLMTPFVFGGEQERKRRAGTENVPAIVAFQKAVEIAEETMAVNAERYTELEKKLVESLRERQIEFTINAEQTTRLPHITNISFPGTDIESFLVNLDMVGICVSSGSACTAGSLDPSHVFMAMYGKDAPELRNSVRFSYGYGVTAGNIEIVAEKVAEIITRLVK